MFYFYVIVYNRQLKTQKLYSYLLNLNINTYANKHSLILISSFKKKNLQSTVSLGILD